MEQELEQQEMPMAEKTSIAVEEVPVQEQKTNWALIAAISVGTLLLTLSFIMTAMFARREQNPEQEPEKETSTELVTQSTQPLFPPNPYGPTDFQYDGDYLTCLAAYIREQCLLSLFFAA